MAEAGVLLDRRGEPTGPVIAWHDARSGTDEARAVADASGVRSSTVAPPADRGPPVRRDHGPAGLAAVHAGQLGWQRAHAPDAAAAVRSLGVPEWVARALGAADVAELSLASRTGMLSLRDRRVVARRAGVARECARTSSPSSCPRARRWGASASGMPAARGAVIAVAGHDHVAAMVGAGATEEGDVLHSSGTADVFVRSIHEPLAPERIVAAVADGVTVGRHVIPDRWALLSGAERSVGLASVLERLGVDGQADRDELNAAAAAVVAAGHEPRARLARRAPGGCRPLRRDARALRRTRRAADADRRDRRRRAGCRGAHRQGGAPGPDRVVARPQATARGAALLAGSAVLVDAVGSGLR